MEDIDLKKEIGKKIRRFRGKIKQKDLAERAGINKVQISRYERGVNSPELETVKKIAQALGVPADFILREEPMGDYKKDIDPALIIREMEAEYKTLPVFQKKIIDNVKEILQSGNEVMIDALVANIRAFLEAIRTKKSNQKEGD